MGSTRTIKALNSCRSAKLQLQSGRLQNLIVALAFGSFYLMLGFRFNCGAVTVIKLLPILFWLQ